MQARSRIVAFGAIAAVACGGTSTEAPDEAPLAAPLGSSARELSSSCTGLVPPAIAPPHLQTRSLGIDDGCLHGMTDGAGNIAMGIFLAASKEASWQVFTLDGVSQGTFLGHEEVALLPQPSGWQASGWDTLTSWIDTYSHTGAHLSHTVVATGLDGADVSLDYGGGVLVTRSFEPTPTTFRVTAQRFSSTGIPRSPPATVVSGAGPAGGAMGGVNLSGHSLVLINDGFGVFTARWLDRVGAPLTPVFKTGVFIPRGGQAFLRALPDNSLVLWVNGDWARRFPDASTNPGPVPSYLSSRPWTNLELLPGGRGFAIWQAYWFDSPPPCSHKIELFAPAGNLCGSITPPLTSCTKGDLTIGRDGTVAFFRSRPCTASPCTCEARWFRHLLR
jgi:hypothetical protein